MSVDCKLKKIAVSLSKCTFSSLSTSNNPFGRAPGLKVFQELKCLVLNHVFPRWIPFRILCTHSVLASQSCSEDMYLQLKALLVQDVCRSVGYFFPQHQHSAVEQMGVLSCKMAATPLLNVGSFMSFRICCIKELMISTPFCSKCHVT